MTTLTETDVEQAALAWLSGLGWWTARAGHAQWGVEREAAAVDL